jgi:hypothetical protein
LFLSGGRHGEARFFTGLAPYEAPTAAAPRGGRRARGRGSVSLMLIRGGPPRTSQLAKTRPMAPISAGLLVSVLNL